MKVLTHSSKDSGELPKSNSIQAATRERHRQRSRNASRALCAVIEIALVAAFLAGFYIDPAILRYIWLVVSGTMMVLCGIYLYLL